MLFVLKKIYAFCIKKKGNQFTSPYAPMSVKIKKKYNKIPGLSLMLPRQGLEAGFSFLRSQNLNDRKGVISRVYF
jgi:hypothetical protein